MTVSCQKESNVRHRESEERGRERKREREIERKKECVCMHVRERISEKQEFPNISLEDYSSVSVKFVLDFQIILCT